MAKFLTKAETQDFNWFGPSSEENAEPWRDTEDTELACLDRWTRNYDVDFSDGDNKRIITALTEFVDRGFSKFSKKFILNIRDAAEESSLNVVSALGCLDVFVSKQTTAPKYAHFYQAFEETAKIAKKIDRRNSEHQRVKEGCAYTVRAAFTPGVLAEIRTHIPDFPDFDDLNAVWKEYWSYSLGLGDTGHNLKESAAIACDMADAISETSAWPVIPLYCLWLIRDTWLDGDDVDQRSQCCSYAAGQCMSDRETHSIDRYYYSDVWPSNFPALLRSAVEDPTKWKNDDDDFVHSGFFICTFKHPKKYTGLKITDYFPGESSPSSDADGDESEEEDDDEEF
jgi:hypothetical protein